MIDLEKKLIKCLKEEVYTQKNNVDEGHDFKHIQRVVALAKKLGKQEKADFNILLPAAYFHDCVLLPKNAPNRKEASSLAAQKASEFLREMAFLEEDILAIAHAIKSHSFSASITPQSIEAKVLQDADRLDALGAIGILRATQTGMSFQSKLYAEEDPFCQKRIPNDRKFIIDHFYTKLLQLKNTMQTKAGKKEAEKRTAFMQFFLQQLESEVCL